MLLSRNQGIEMKFDRHNLERTVATFKQTYHSMTYVVLNMNIQGTKIDKN